MTFPNKAKGGETQINNSYNKIKTQYRGMKNKNPFSTPISFPTPEK